MAGNLTLLDSPLTAFITTIPFAFNNMYIEYLEQIFVRCEKWNSFSLRPLFFENFLTTTMAVGFSAIVWVCTELVLNSFALTKAIIKWNLIAKCIRRTWILALYNIFMNPYFCWCMSLWSGLKIRVNCNISKHFLTKSSFCASRMEERVEIKSFQAFHYTHNVKYEFIYSLWAWAFLFIFSLGCWLVLVWLLLLGCNRVCCDHHPTSIETLKIIYENRFVSF